MSQNLEIEFKNMLTQTEYKMLIETFHISEKEIFTQENHYFDTPDFLLKEKGSALRIRRKGFDFEMTLKQPHEAGLLETNQTLSPAEVNLAITAGTLPSGMIEKLVSEMEIPFSKIQYFGSLVTERAEIKYKNGLLVFDHSFYLNKEDFELEYEVENYNLGKEIFIELLTQHQIPHRKTENKIRRFYQQKYTLGTK